MEQQSESTVVLLEARGSRCRRRFAEDTQLPGGVTPGE